MMKCILKYPNCVSQWSRLNTLIDKIDLKTDDNKNPTSSLGRDHFAKSSKEATKYINYSSLNNYIHNFCN